MATKDDVLTETDDDIEVIEVDAAPGEEAKAAEAAAKEDKEPPAASEDDEEDDDQEDARLADRDADPEETAEDAEKRKRKLGQRQRQRQAAKRNQEELEALRREIAELRRGQTEIRNTNLSVSEGMVNSRLEEVRRDIATADAILAEAVKNSDGDSYAQALKLRDEAKAQEAELANTAKGFAEAKKAPVETDTEVSRLASAWKASNPWYRSDGSDTHSAVVNAIDAGLMAEGRNPGTREYWSELTRRVAARFKSEEAPRERKDPVDDNRRKGPAIGDRGGAVNGNGSGKRTVHLSKERVDAIKQAGDWDDPVERAKAIKAYEQYDREQSANR